MSTLREMAEAVYQKSLQDYTKDIADTSEELARDAAMLKAFADDSADLDAIHYGK